MSIYVVHYKEFRQNGRNLVTEAGEVGVGEKIGDETWRERERERERETDDPPTYSSTLRSPTGTGVHVFPIVSFLARSASHCSLLTAPPLSFSPST